MCTYKYLEPDTGLVYTMSVTKKDVAIINGLALGMCVKLASEHQLIVGQDGVVLIVDKKGKKSSADLMALKKGLIS